MRDSVKSRGSVTAFVTFFATRTRINTNENRIDLIVFDQSLEVILQWIKQ